MHTLILPLRAQIVPVHYKRVVCAFGCIDDNFFDVFEDLVRDLKRTRANEMLDRIVIPGGAMPFSSPSKPYHWETALDFLDVSLTAHEAIELVLTTHAECAAYGARAKVGGTRASEFEFHVAEHHAMERRLAPMRPELVGHIKHYYISTGGVVEIDLSKETPLNEGEAVALRLAA